MFPLRATNIEDSLLTQFARFLESAIPNIPQAFQFLQCQEITQHRLHANMTGSLNQFISLSPSRHQHEQ